MRKQNNISSFKKLNLIGLVIFAVSLFLCRDLAGQAISNTGANISLSNGAYIFSNDLVNTSGTLTNNGTVDLLNELNNSDEIRGNGLYILKGHWKNYGIFDPGQSLVTFNGSAGDQTIYNYATGENFYNLTLDNPHIITQIIPAFGGTLNIGNDLKLLKGTLRLHQNTSNVLVVNAASIAGNLIYDNLTDQTVLIRGNLTGPGAINMAGDGRVHILNLMGEINEIGTFLTAAGESVVNYKRPSGTQTVFGSMNYRHLIISGGGIKTMQGNSTVGYDLNISGGTFDLGTIPTSLVISRNTLIAGSLLFNGGSTKIATLNGDLDGTGSIDMSGGDLSHVMNLDGTGNNIGTFSSGNSSTVFYRRDGPQTVFKSDDYNNISITGNNIKTLLGDVRAKGTLTMASGDIDADAFVMEVSNPAINAINRSAGKVIGRLRRSVSSTSGEYLYPVGVTSYNPFKIRFLSVDPGSLTVQFRQEDIGNSGLPIDDDGNEIYETYDTGFWTLTSSIPGLSNKYNIKTDFSGFTGIDASASIIKRTNGGNLEVDGDHAGITGNEIARDELNGISTGATDIGIGKGRPRIVRQPEDFYVCETFDAFFEVTTRGRGVLTWQWEFSTDGGLNFSNVVDVAGLYTGAQGDRLDILNAPYSMNGYIYRCIITDEQGHENITVNALLTVDKIPVATATIPPPACPGVQFQDIILGTSNSVAGTTFFWTRTPHPDIQTGMPLSGQTMDKIIGTLDNTSDTPVDVEFIIVPKGPGRTFCVGDAITVSVRVNPHPRVFAIPPYPVQCDRTVTSISLTSPSTFSSGNVSFRYTVTTTGNVTGYTTPTTGLSNGHIIADLLVNNTNTPQKVIYRIVPMSPVCTLPADEGMPVIVEVTVNPTPIVEPHNMKPAICFGGTTEIVLTSPTVMTGGTVLFNYAVSATGGGVVTGDFNPANGLLEDYAIQSNFENSSHELQTVTYTITPVSSICGNGTVTTSEVGVHAIPIWDIEQTKPLTCDVGAGLGALSAKLSTGASPYHIVWNGPDNYHNEDLADIDNLTSGAYYATVTDNLGCQGDFVSYLVPEYAIPYNLAVGGSTLSCIGATDGDILIGVQSGITAPYSYVFMKNGTEILGTGVFTSTFDVETRLFENLGIGTYTLTITDKNMCSRSKSVTLRNPQPIVAILEPKKYNGDFNTSCKGYNDGSAWVQSVSGGRPGYTYRWFTSDGIIPGPINTNRIDNLIAGTYYCEVTDANSCKEIFSIELMEPDGMSLIASLLSHSNDGNYNVSCNGGNDGSIGMTISGGSGSYLFNWTGPEGYTSNTKDISGLKAGTYTCMITDNNGCILTPIPSFTLSEPDPLTVSAVPSVSADGSYQINCFGGTGSINVTAVGGSTDNYTYTWSTADGSGIVPGMQNQTSLKAGTYHVEVLDFNGCLVTRDIVMREPPNLILSLVPKHISCEIPGLNNGAIDLTASGGAGSLSYIWSDGSTSQDISGLTEGVYSVEVIYNNSCSVSGSASVNLPPELTYTKRFSNFNGYEVSCHGMSDGEIHISMTNGKAPFTYSWSGPDGFSSTSPEITGLRAGTYRLVITDSNMCSVAEEFDIREPGELQPRFILSQSITGGFNINCAGDSTGSITVNPQNSVNNVSYLWSDGVFGRSRNNLKAGMYTVVLTDDNNCQSVGTVTLTEPDSIKVSHIVKPPFCPDMPDGEISISVTGGIPGAVYSYRWSDNSTATTLSGITMGEYKVRVEDPNMCVVRDSIMLTPENDACLIIPNVISPNGDLINDYWNIGMKELYPEMEVKIFNRWGKVVWRSVKGYPQPWDGKNRGTVLPIDSYHYMIDLHNGKKPIIGNVTIVK